MRDLSAFDCCDNRFQLDFNKVMSVYCGLGVLSAIVGWVVGRWQSTGHKTSPTHVSSSPCAELIPVTICVTVKSTRHT